MLSLTYASPFDWNGLGSWIAARAIAGIESIDGDTYTRGDAIVRRDASRNMLVVSHRVGQTRVSVRNGSGGQTRVSVLHRYAECARRLFDVDADPRAIAAVLRKDALLAPLVKKRPGVRVPGAWDPFELAIRAIVGQQISVAGARTILGRIAASTGFAPERLAEITLDGMPRRRAETIRAIATAVASGELNLERASVDDLCELPGIGPWTANYIAMRAVHDPDAFPAGDLILRRNAGGLTEKELLRRAEAWRPYRAYAAMLLWLG